MSRACVQITPFSAREPEKTAYLSDSQQQTNLRYSCDKWSCALPVWSLIGTAGRRADEPSGTVCVLSLNDMSYRREAATKTPRYTTGENNGPLERRGGGRGEGERRKREEGTGVRGGGCERGGR